MLVKLRQKLENQLELGVKYYEKFKTAVSKGHIARVSDAELQEKTLSMPHYYIQHFNKSQLKLRVVYDAAQEHEGISLNILFERGPIFMQS